MSVRETNCGIRWIVIYTVDSVIQLLKNWGLDDNKPTTSLKKSELGLFQTSLIQFHLICQMFAKFWFGVESKMTVSGRKRKKKILRSVHQLHKAGA